MQAINWRTWLWQYGAPLVLLAGSLALLFVVLHDPDGPVMLWGFLVAPGLALLTGFVMRPRHAWVVALAAWVLLCIASTVADVLGVMQPMVPLPVEWFYFAVFSALALLFLTWLGRQFRLWLDRLEQSRRQKGWHASAS